MKFKALFILSLLFFSTKALLATVYTTTGDGNINGNIWSPSKPTSPLAAGDEIIIAHDVNLSIDFVIYGKMTINSGASLYSSGNKKLKIGEGSTTGELINNGTIDIKELKVKGDNTVQNLTAPSITNNGTITVDKLHVGDNAGAGILTNSSGSTITVNGEAHIDNILNNEGDMTITDNLKLHGGTVQGNGNITTPIIEFDENNGRAGSITDQNICDNFGTSSEPTIEINGGSSYSSLNDFVNGETISGSNHNIDESNFYSCGVNALGMALPVELTYFNGRNSKLEVILDWGTASELNSDYFQIERSTDAINFTPLDQVDAYGTTNDYQYYNYIDKNPLAENYYRLKQVDNDGSYAYSNIVVVSVGEIVEEKLTIFPTTAYDQIKVHAELRDNAPFSLTVFNLYGQQIFSETFSPDNKQFRMSFDVSNLEHGHYNMVLKSSSKLVTSKFLVVTQR